jgi:exodeoxyribonuclease V gamma subunit
MGIQLFVSNQLSKLSQQLTENLQSAKTNVFDKNYIITQTEGINTWLKGNIAASLGIAANCSFNKPNDIVFLLQSLFVKDTQSSISADYLKWAIYRQLGDNEFVSRFPNIANYYQNNDIKKIALAENVADLFDQYQMYRHKLIEEWNRQNATNLVTNDWQQYIWIQLKSKTKNEFQDKSSIINAIINALKEEHNVQLIKKKIPVLYFFGIAVITPFYLKLFNYLSQFIDIQFYLLNPAPTSYWLEDLSEKQIAKISIRNKNAPSSLNYLNQGNALLVNWGNIVKESFALLFEEEQYINQYDDSLSVEPTEPTTLLEKIKHDIFYNAVDDRNKIKLSNIYDGSITINACFTQVREVEVLYNYLVELIDKRKEKLSARDIVVMVSDIDAYAPFIRAVFDNAPINARFPYSIADESISSGNNFFSALELLLNIDENSFKAEEIMELLESVYIRERFGIDDIDFIRGTVKAAGIKFGLNGDVKDETRLVSWEYGLQRIILGICISGEPLYDTGNEVLLPLDNCEGTDTVHLIRFWNFIQVLKSNISKRHEKRTVTGWSEYLCNLVEAMVFESKEQEDEDYHQFIKYTEQLSLLTELEDVEINFEVFRHSFLNILKVNKRTQAFSGKGITFCSLIPMRSIPFNVVAMLGMDFDKFPRRESPVSFSKIEEKRERGDRKIKDNDKHLFLENILSAQKYLYISYIGKSAKDASVIPPSSVVEELTNYIEQGVEIGGEKLTNAIVKTHPLHGFSQQYFNGSGLISYLKEPQAFNLLKSKSVNSENSTIVKDVNLEQLITFFKDPLKWFFNKKLKVYYREDEILLPETEVFNLDSLSSWVIKNDLLKMPESEQDKYLEREKLSGNLPLKNIGKLLNIEMKDAVKEINEIIQEITQSKLNTPQNIHLNVDDLFLSGIVKSVYDENMISVCTSSKRNKNIIGAFIEYTALRAQNLPIDFHFFQFSKKADIQYFKLSHADYPETKAYSQLQFFIKAFVNTNDKLFSFYPGFSINPFKMFEGDFNNFSEKIEKIKRSEYDFTFNDPYFDKGYFNGFFGEEYYEALKNNSLTIFENINTLIPGSIE